MSKEPSKTMQPEEVSYQELTDQIGETNLKDIISELGLAAREAYAGEELQEIQCVHAKMKELKTQNVSKAIAAYLESLDDVETQAVETPGKGKKTKKKKVTPKAAASGKGKIAAPSKEVEGDMQNSFVKTKEVEAQVTAKAGVQDGSKLAKAYRHGRQVGFLKQVMIDTIADAKLIEQQLGNITDHVLDGITIDTDALFGEIEIPQIEGIEETESATDGSAGLGFTGKWAELCQGNLDDEAAALLSGEELEEELEPDEEEELVLGEIRSLLELPKPSGNGSVA